MWRRIRYAGIITATLFCAAVLVLVAFAWWTGFRFVDVVRMGWFGLIFARLAVLFAVILALRRLWRSFPRTTAWITVVISLGCGAFAVVKSFSPDGTYGFVGEIEPMNESPDLAPELYHKDHYLRLSNGKMEDCYGDSCTLYGRYEKTANGWRVINETAREDYTWRLEFSVLGFHQLNMAHRDEVGGTEFYPRRFLPFPRPYWMPDWLQ
jgi:hypothetical protein